jgi:hypothetical protein
MKRAPLKTFRIVERGAEGRIIARRVQVEDFEQIEVGWRTIAIEQIDPVSGDLIQAVWPKDRSEG